MLFGIYCGRVLLDFITLPVDVHCTWVSLVVCRDGHELNVLGGVSK